MQTAETQADQNENWLAFANYWTKVVPDRQNGDIYNDVDDETEHAGDDDYRTLVLFCLPVVVVATNDEREICDRANCRSQWL